MLNGNSGIGESASSVGAGTGDARPGEPQVWHPFRVVW